MLWSAMCSARLYRLPHPSLSQGDESRLDIFEIVLGLLHGVGGAGRTFSFDRSLTRFSCFKQHVAVLFSTAHSQQAATKAIGGKGCLRASQSRLHIQCFAKNRHPFLET